jgi:phage shock protein A
MTTSMVSARRIAALVFALGLLLGCEGVHDAKGPRREAKKELAELERRFEELSSQSAKARARTEDEAERALAEIRNKTDSLARYIDGLNPASKLDGAREEMRRELDELKQKIEKARTKLE